MGCLWPEEILVMSTSTPRRIMGHTQSIGINVVIMARKKVMY